MQLHDSADTTTLSYWLNWRVYLCAVCVLLPMVLAFLVIWKREYSRDSTSGKGKNQHDRGRSSSGDEAWKPCLKEIHPICLLAFRVIAFSSLLATLIAKISINGGTIFYYYTQWTFTLVTIYFGCACMLSVYGCYQYKTSTNTFNVNFSRIDVEQGPNMPLLHHDAANVSRMEHHADIHAEIHNGRVAATLSHIFQVLFQTKSAVLDLIAWKAGSILCDEVKLDTIWQQLNIFFNHMNAGAVMLTDCVYWFIIFPFLTLKDYDLNFMTVNMHTLNGILLLGDAALNCLQIPWTGMSFFVLWTGAFVIFQWIIHACVSIWWPYPFLDLSSPLAPLWYLLVAMLHIPCYAFFVLIVEMKHYFLSKWFPSSYQC